MLEGSTFEKSRIPTVESNVVSLAELARMAAHYVVTAEDVAAMEMRLEAAERGFVAEARGKEIDQNWLDRSYTI